jgi:hypothetical protein
MKVKFTNPLDDKQVVFGTILQMFNNTMFVVHSDLDDCRYIINPNSDYNFRFIPNEEADNKFREALNRKVDELDALEKKSKKSC